MFEDPSHSDFADQSNLCKNWTESCRAGLMPASTGGRWVEVKLCAEVTAEKQPRREHFSKSDSGKTVV